MDPDVAATVANELRAPLPSPSTMNDMSSVLALYKLLDQASSLPCSSGAAAFWSLIPSENNWFPLALDALLPALQDQSIQTPQRILAAYLLDAIYASHEHRNPFHDHLIRIFESERDAAVAHSTSFGLVGSPDLRPGSPHEAGGALQAENEQLVWVLWKISRGEGEDLAPYSPNILSRTALPEHLRALHLVLEDEPQRSPDVHINTFYSPNTEVSPHLTTMRTTSHATHPNSAASPSALSPHKAFPTPSTSRTAYTSSFSPFDDEPVTDFRGSQYQNVPERADAETGGWLREVASGGVHQVQYQVSPDFARLPYAQPSSHEATSSSPTDPHEDQRRQALLRSLCEVPQPQGGIEAPLYLRVGASGSETDFSARSSTSNGGMRYEPSQSLRGSHTDMQPQPSALPHRQPLPHLQLQFPASQLDTQGHRDHMHYESAPTTSPFFASFPASVSNNNAVVTRARPQPIARPRPAASLYYTSTPYAAPPAPEIAYTNGLASQQARGPLIDAFSQQARTGVALQQPTANGSLQQTSANGFSQQMRANGFSPQTLTTPGHGLPQQPRLTPPNGVSPTARTPGVIGSGRPSASTSKNVSPVESTRTPGVFSAAERRPHVGVIGNGRLASSLMSNGTLAVQSAAETNSGRMMPWSVLRTDKTLEDDGKRGLGPIGRPNGALKENETTVEWRLNDGAEKTVRTTAGLPGIERRLTFMDASTEKVSSAAPELPRQATDTSSPVHLGGTQSTPGPPVIPLQTAPQPKTPSPVTRAIPALTSSLEKGLKLDERDPSPSFSRHSPIPPSASPSVGRPELRKPSEILHLPPVREPAQKVPSESKFNQTERDELSRAILLLVSARNRVLTLPEQRMLLSQLPMLTSPLSLLRPCDLPPLVAKNPDVAVKLLVMILNRDDVEGAQLEQMFRDLSKNDLFRLACTPESRSSFPPGTVPSDPAAAVDVVHTAVEFVNTFGAPSTATSDSSGPGKVSLFGGREAREGYLDALRRLPPTMQSFNLVARLLRPPQLGAAALSEPSEQKDIPEVKVAKLVRAEVLGGLVSACMQWIEHTEQEEREGEILDDRVAVAVSSLSRFYTFLLKHDFVSAVSEVDTTEIMSFALQFSRFEEARSLYSTLAAARA